MRQSPGLLAVVLLCGCPWISGPPLGADDIDPDTDDADVVCIDVDFDDVCDDVDACVDGVDDTVDQTTLRAGESVSGWACGDDDLVALRVDAGCTYAVTVDAPASLGVEVFEDSYLLASGPAPLMFEAMSASFTSWELNLFGDDDAYTVSAVADCPACSTQPVTADWGDIVAGRLCPRSPELTVVMRTVRSECTYGVNLVTSDQTLTTLLTTDGGWQDMVSGSSGYLAIIGPASPNATEFRVVVRQPASAQVEQGVRLELAEYCN
ncbi:MAG: hypothetical protein ACJATT_001193 [Myxococcota bacterium]